MCQVEKELKDICRDVLDILDKHLIPAASSGESKVFYYKMYAALDVFLGLDLHLQLMSVQSN